MLYQLSYSRPIVYLVSRFPCRDLGVVEREGFEPS